MKRFEREEGVAFYNAEEDEEEKTKKLKRKETSRRKRVRRRSRDSSLEKTKINSRCKILHKKRL
jgi:hypothetical protein